jgi:hypothetical protein
MTTDRRSALFIVVLLGVIVVALLVSFGNPGRATLAQVGNEYITELRFMEAPDLGMRQPAGVSYWPAAEALIVLEAADGTGTGQRADIVITTLYEDLLGGSRLEGLPSQRLNVVVDSQGENLLVLNPETQELWQVRLPAVATLDEAMAVVERIDVSAYGLQGAQGMTLDPESNRLFILDAKAGSITVVTADGNGRFDGEAAKEGRIEQIMLPELRGVNLRGIAFDPYSRHLYVLDVERRVLYELLESGRIVSTRPLDVPELADPQGMVFGSSADLTDAPELTSLYLADAGRDLNGNWVEAKIIELSLTPPVALLPSSLNTDISLVQIIDTSLWSPPSPDPSGVDYHPGMQRLIVSDSEVNEMPIYDGVNVFLAQTDGTLTGGCNTLDFSNEPTEVTVNPANGHIFFSDDSEKRIFEVNPGPDNVYCTGDDIVTWFRTAAFNSRDPEGVAYGQGNLFIADGVNTQVYRVSPGPNGVFDGVPPAGDDQVTDFDTASMGLRDPEGIGFHQGRGTLFIVSRKDKILVETTPDGTVVQTFDIRFLNAVAPAGVGTGPGSQNPSVTNIYLSARGVDNNSDPDENDGKIYELALDAAPTPPAADIFLPLVANIGL